MRCAVVEFDWNLAIASGRWKDSVQCKLNTLGNNSNVIPHAFANDGISREEIVLTAIESLARRAEDSPSPFVFGHTALYVLSRRTKTKNRFCKHYSP